MRVAVVIGQLNHMCGPSVHSTRLVRQLTASGHEAFLVHSTPDGEAESRLLQEFSDTLLPLPFRHPLDPRIAIGFAQHLRRTRPEVVVFQLPTAMYALSHVAKHFGMKTVYMAGNILQYNAKWMQWTLPLLCNRTIDLLAGCSDEVVRSFVEAGYRGPTIRIPLGVEWPGDEELRIERSRIRCQLGYAQDEMVFCTVGRLVSDKQQIHLLRACRELRDRGKQFRFLIVGDGEVRQDLEAYCRGVGLTDTVHFAGWQSDVFPFLAAADAFVFHSTDTAEGLGAVNLEAAAVGLPLILADLRCLREIWPDGNGVSFASMGQPTAFANCMEELINCPEKHEALGRSAAEKVRAEYSCEAMARAYIDMFEEILA